MENFYIDESVFLDNFVMNLPLNGFWEEKMLAEMLSEEGMTSFELVNHVCSKQVFKDCLGNAVYDAAVGSTSFLDVGDALVWDDKADADKWREYLMGMFRFLDINVYEQEMGRFEMCINVV